MLLVDLNYLKSKTLLMQLREYGLMAFLPPFPLV